MIIKYGRKQWTYDRLTRLAELLERPRRPTSMVWATPGVRRRRKCEGCAACEMMMSCPPRCDGSGWEVVWP